VGIALDDRADIRLQGDFNSFVGSVLSNGERPFDIPTTQK
jgi:hypothetical protein